MASKDDQTGTFDQDYILESWVDELTYRQKAVLQLARMAEEEDE